MDGRGNWKNKEIEVLKGEILRGKVRNKEIGRNF